MPLLLLLATALSLVPASSALASNTGPVSTAASPDNAYADKVEAAWTVAQSTSLGYSEILTAWEGQDQLGLEAMYVALSNLGASYSYASRGPSFDCSGLTGHAWAAVGVELGNNSSVQNRSTVPSPRVPGALVYRPGHIAMSLGVEDYVIHAASSSTGVIISRMPAGSVTYPEIP